MKGRLLWEQTQGFVGWLKWLRAVGFVLLIRVSHTVQTSSPLTWYYMLEVITADEVDRRRRSNQQLIRKMVDSCQEPDKPDTCVPTHIRKDNNDTTRRKVWDTICQSKGSISTTLSKHWQNPKSTWLKLDLCNSAQTVSVTSESFSPDWRHSVAFVIVTASLWQVYALVHIDLHSHKCTQLLQKWALIFVSD